MTEPCWDGYEQIGMKMKNGKKVPNCVPIKRAKTLSTPEEQAAKIEAAALALVEDANFEFSGTRRVTNGAALEVVARSLAKNADEPFSIRKHRALVELSHYITLAQHNRVMTTAEHMDLLPVAHPRSTRLNGLTAAALLKARARWITDDPSIDDPTVRTLLASALTTHISSAERQYALSRLESFPEGQVPQYALVAAFEGYTSDERRANAEKQLRDRKGRFVFMGGSVRALIQRLDGQVQNLVGKVVGRDGANNEVHVELPNNRIVRLPANKVEGVQAVIPSKQSKDGFGDVVNASSADAVIKEADLNFIDAPGAFQKDESWAPNKDDADYYGDIDGEMFTNGLHEVVKVPNNQFAKDQFEMADQREREGQRVVATGDGENGGLDPEKPVFILKRKGGDGRPFAVVQNWDAIQDFAEQDGPRMENNEQPNPARLVNLDQPKAEKKPKAKLEDKAPEAEAPAEPEGPQRKVKEQPKRFRDAFMKGFRDGLAGRRTAPEGFHDVDREGFEPQGAIDGQTSPDFTDDPAELAQRFTPEQLQDALKNAVVGSKESPAPGFGRLPFEQGDEIVPADALFHAIKEQGGDADKILNDIYAPPKEKKAKAVLPVDEETKSVEGIDVPEAPVSKAPTAEVPPLIEGQTAEEQRNFIDNGDYKAYLPENLEPDVVPEGYVALDNDPFDAEGAAIPEGAPEGFSSNPIDLALGYDKEDLKSELRRAIEPGNAMPGNGILAQEDENGEIFEAYVPGEAIRDALQLQGEDTNKLIDDIYKEGAEQPSAQEIADAVEGDNAKEESAKPAEPSPQDAQGPNADSAKAGLPSDNEAGRVQGMEEAPEGGAGATAGVVAEGSQEADLAMGEPRREMVRAADLQPGDIAVRDNEFFVIEEVAAPAPMSERGQKDKGRNRINVKGYYPGHQTQDRDWFANGNIEVIRGVAAPAKGDGEPLNKPKLEDYVGGPKDMKKIDGEWGAKDPAVQEKYAADLAAHKAAVQAAGADFVDPTKKEAEEGFVAKAELVDAVPAANAPVIAKLKASDLQVGDITTKDHFRITNITKGEDGKLLVEGHYPGQGLQTKQWWPNTRIEVIRGIDEANAPQLGEGSLHRPAGEGPKGGWFPVSDAELNAAHEARIAEAKARWEAPADLPVVSSGQLLGEDKLEENIKAPTPPREPAYPAFMGKFAEWAREAAGNWAEFKKKLAGQDIIVFDFETTGIGVEDGNEPWQIAAVKMRDGKIIDRINIFMNPGKSLKGTYAGDNAKDPDGNPLTDDFFADKPTQAEGLQQFLDWAGANPLAVAQNAKFDDEVMKRKAAELGLEWNPAGMADTMGMAAEIFKDAPDAPGRKNLNAIAEFLGIKNENWHDGANDAEVTAQAFIGLIDKAAEGNFGVAALDADAQQAAYDAKMAELAPRIEEFKKAAAEFLAKKALKDGLAGKEVNLEAIQKEIPTPLPEGPIDNVGAMDNPEQAPKPQADLVDVQVMSAFPEGKMRIAEPGWADDIENVEVLGRGDIHANSLRPGDFVHPKKDDPEFMQIVSIRGGEEFGVEEWKRRVVMQNADGEQKVAIWNQNAFLDEVRRPKDRKALAGEPLPEAPRTPEEMNMQAVSVAEGNAVLEIGPDGNEFVMKARLLDNEGNEIYAAEGRYLSPEAAEAEGKALLRRAGQEQADQKRRNAGQPASKAKSVAIGVEPANVDQLPVIENVDNLEIGEGQNEITPRVEEGNVIYKSDAKVVDDGEVVAQIVEDFPNKKAASEGGRNNLDAAAEALAQRIKDLRDGALLRSEGRGRKNLPPIPEKYRRQVYLRMLAGLYADADGNPLAIGDKVIHENPKMAGKYGEGVVVGKVQGRIGGLQRKGVVYIDYVRVQYPDGSIRKYVSRFQRHVDGDVAKQRFADEPRINWMNQDEMDIALEERRKKPRKGNEAVDAADVEVQDVVKSVKNVVDEAVPAAPAFQHNIEWFKLNAAPRIMRAGAIKVGDFLPTKGDKNIGRVISVEDLNRAVRIEVEYPDGRRWAYRPIDKDFNLNNVYRLDEANAEAAPQAPAAEEKKAPEVQAPAAPQAQAAPAAEPSDGVVIPELPAPAQIDLRGAKKQAQALAARIKDKPLPDVEVVNANANLIEFNRNEILEALAPENDRRRDKGLNLGLDKAIKIAKTFGWFEEAQEMMAIRQRKSVLQLREMPEDFKANVAALVDAFPEMKAIRKEVKAIDAWRNRRDLDALRGGLENMALFPDIYNANFRGGLLGARNAVKNLIDNVEKPGNNPELAERIREFGKLFDTFGDLPKLPKPKGVGDNAAAERLARIAQDLGGMDINQLRNGAGDWVFAKNVTDGINGLYLLRNRVTGEEVLVKYDNDRNSPFKGNGINAEEMIAQLYRELGFAAPAFLVLNPDLQDAEHRGVGLMEFAGDGFFGLQDIDQAVQIDKHHGLYDNLDMIAAEHQEEILNFLVANGIVGNTDRHKKNFMFGRDENGYWRLVPIDNGLAMFNGGFGKAERHADNPVYMPPDNVIRGYYGNSNGARGLAAAWIRKIGRDNARNQVIEFAERMKLRAEAMELRDPRGNAFISARAQWIIDNVDQYLDAIMR